jgi:hypothetical protein
MEMKHAIIDATVTRRQGAEFDSGKQVQLSLEDGFSFNLAVSHSLAKKINEGDIVSLTYTSAQKKPFELKSGATMDFTTLYGVEVTNIQKSRASELFKDLEDVELPKFRDFTTTGNPGQTSDTKDVGKV